MCLQFKVIYSVNVTTEFLDSSESRKRRNLVTVSVEMPAAVPGVCPETLLCPLQ